MKTSPLHLFKLFFYIYVIWGGGASRLALYYCRGSSRYQNPFYVRFWSWLKQSICVYILSLYFPYLYFVVTCNIDKINKYFNCQLCMQVYKGTIMTINPEVMQMVKTSICRASYHVPGDFKIFPS